MNKQEAIKRLEEIEQEKAELEEIINKPERWQDELVQPNKGTCYYIESMPETGFEVFTEPSYMTKPEHAFRTKEQAELIKEKMLLMQEMHAFAHVRNKDWKADWEDWNQIKYGVEDLGHGFFEATSSYDWNDFAFGVAVKSEEIAEEMLSIFGERIEEIYNKQY